MKIIDAHIHYQLKNAYFDRLAQDSGHENTMRHLLEAFSASGIECAVAMGGLAADPVYPDFLRYCFGIHRNALNPKTNAREIARAEQNLRCGSCVGLKIYAGYTHCELCDPVYTPFYELAQCFGKPVAVHTGVTASSDALLRYSHPLQLDAAAVAFPRVQFVMCHFGNPWITDAAAVLEKNPNVCADLSGLLVGKVDVADYARMQYGYVEHLRTWISYVDEYEKFLYGSDWPLTNIEGYISLMEHIIPERHLEAVYYENAQRVYGL